MQSNECGIHLSASGLMRFAGCAHATTLDLARIKGGGPAPTGDSEDAELLQRHGDAHEAGHLARLRAAGRGVVEIVREGASLAQGAVATRDAPRGMGFLFSPERISVALSRARGLALVFAAPRLHDATCTTPEEVRLVDTLCALPVTDTPAALGDAV